MAECAVAGCSGMPKALGLCDTHYWRKRTGRPLNTPIKKRAGLLRYTDHEMGVILDRSLTAKQAADLCGVAAHTVNRLRRLNNAGALRTSSWLDDEIDFIIEHRNVLTDAQMAAFLNRTRKEVSTEVARLKANGFISGRARGSVPWHVGSRPLIAKTCPTCGHLLDASWFRGTGKKWASSCTSCSNLKYANRKAEKTKRRVDALQALTEAGAVNRGQEWTEADLSVLSDMTKTRFEKAIELKRTYKGVANATSRFGFSSAPLKRDPNSSAWKLFYEMSA